jgi:hypothetical protein
MCAKIESKNMALEELGNSRVIYRNLESGLGVIIPSRKNYFTLAFLMVWLAGWTIGGIAAITALLMPATEGLPQAFMLFWLCGWAIGWIFATTTILWQLFGKEIIIVTSGVLTIYKSLHFGFHRKMYAVGNIRNMEHHAQPARSKFYNKAQVGSIFGISVLSFDYGAKTINFGRGLDKAEARNLLEFMKKKIPSVLNS